MAGEGNLYLRGESAVGHELSAGVRGGELGLPCHISEEVDRRPEGEDRRVDVNIVKAGVLEVDVDGILLPMSQQDKMKKCNVDAWANSLKGDERKSFMSECLKADKKS